MSKEQIIILYLGGVVAYENEELMYRLDEAFNEKSGSLTGFAVWDIFLFIVFYPFYFLVFQIDKFDSKIADDLVWIFNRVMWFIFSPIYALLILWNKLER